MEIGPIPQVLVAIIALLLSAFFTLLKYTYEDLNKYKVEKMKEEDIISDSEENELYNLIEGLNEVQSTFMISDYLANSFVAASLAQLGFYFYKTVGAVIAILIATILILVFGESAPYFIAKAKGFDLSVKFMTFARIYSRIFSPLVIFIRSISKGISSLFGWKKDSVEPKITEDQLFNAMNLSKDEGLLDINEYGMIEKLFDFSDTYVKDVMTPRTDVVALDIDSTTEEIVNLFYEEGYSRIPVFEEDIDHIIGILHVKDLLPVLMKNEDIDLRKSLRKPIFSFEYQKSSDLFSQMRKNNATMAIVLDEYGGTDGIVTMEDLIEEIVGEIDDEYDEATDDEEIKKLNANVYVMDGITRLEDIREHLNLEIFSEEVDTIGGFIFEKFDRIPEQGEVLEYENLIFTILELEKNRISRVKLDIN